MPFFTRKGVNPAGYLLAVIDKLIALVWCYMLWIARCCQFDNNNSVNAPDTSSYSEHH